MYKLTSAVLKFIQENNLIEQDDKIVTGISGGIDSVCLFYVLLELREALSFELFAVHVEHGIRGESSKRDEGFVRALCREEAIPLIVFNENVLKYAAENGLSTEEAARQVRYDDFQRAMSQFGADKLAVAHHKNDQAETFLFNLARGSSLKGLTAMGAKRDWIIRPLLSCTREEIEAYAREKALDYVVDESNQDNNYTRNRIRNVVIPELEKVAPMTVSHIVRACETVREADVFISEISDRLYTESVTKTGQGLLYNIDIESFRESAHILKSYVIKRILREMTGRWKDISSINIEDILGLIEKQSGRRIELPYGISALRAGNRLIIGFKEEMEHKAGEKVWFELINYEPSMGFPENNYTKWIDYDKISFGLCVRTRQPGDKIAIDSALHEQSLKKFFINEKVPVNEREGSLLVADGSDIVWVIGYRLSEKYKLGAGSKRAVKINAIGGSNIE